MIENYTKMQSYMFLFAVKSLVIKYLNDVLEGYGIRFVPTRCFNV